MLKTIICTVCPLSCEITLKLAEDGKVLSVKGNDCIRGERYAVKEVTAPERTLTSVIKARGGIHPLLPVRTDRPIPKEKLLEAMLATRDLEVNAPLATGDVIAENFLNLGVNLIASRDL